MADTGVITERDFPITTLWVFKSPIIIILINIIALVFGYIYPVLIIALPIMLIANPLIRKNFHFALEEKTLSIRQGVLSKRQKNIPYGVIQNVFVKQDLFDRIFGLASLRIENAAQGGGKNRPASWLTRSFGSRTDDTEDVGAWGNKVSLPGLKKQSAEELKNRILQKIKENPIEDSHSGL